MSTCNLNSFVGTVNVHTHSFTHTIHALMSLMIRCLQLHEGLQAAPQVKTLRGIHLAVKDAKLTMNRRVSMSIWG